MTRHALELVVGVLIILAVFAALSGVKAASCGLASWYGSESGNRTANGERFDERSLTAAHRSLPFGTKLRVTFQGKSVVVRINDRGPAKWTGRALDLSKAAARRIGLIRPGHGRVCWTRLR